MNAPATATGASNEDWEPGDGSATDRLWLADWRRRIDTLYADVRATARADRVIALAHWRAVRESLYRTHPQSPVPRAERPMFRALHFDSDGSMRFDVRLDAAPAENSVGSVFPPGSGIDTLSFRRIGTISLPLPAGLRRLSVFWMAGYSGGLFIPFRDTTSDAETYAGGRYLLDTGKGADLGGDPVAGTITIDFDYASQPSCAFDPRWSCPLAPPENWLDVPIRAGERLR